MARILSIDYGKKRTGLAVTDPLQIIAGGLATVPTAQLYDYLVKYISEESVELIVIGEPRQPNGEPSENLARVRQFVARWKNHQQVPIIYYDERFTSVLAHQAILDSGVGKQRRREDKGMVDEISATIILQSYLENRNQIGYTPKLFPL